MKQGKHFRGAYFVFACFGNFILFKFRVLIYYNTNTTISQ